MLFPLLSQAALVWAYIAPAAANNIHTRANLMFEK